MQEHWARLDEPSKTGRKEETKSKAEQTVSHVSRRSFLKKAVPVIAGVGLAGVLRIDPTLGASSNTHPSQGTQLSTASYIIYYQDNFYAQNGTSGAIDYSGTDAATVIQAAIDALTEGGLIVLRRGIYTLTNSIRVGQGIQLVGERGAVIRVVNGSQDTANPFNMIEVAGDDATIEGIELDGNASSNPNIAGTTLYPGPANPDMQSGVVIHAGRNVKILDCYIHDIWNAGIWLRAIDTVEGTEIAGCRLESTGVSHVDPSTTNRPQSANAIYVLRQSTSTSKARIHNNFIKDTFGRGIYLHFDSDSIVSDNVIVNSRFCSTETAGIVLDDFIQRTIVKGNQISGYSPGIYLVWRGCENVILEGNSCTNAPNAGGAGMGILLLNNVAGAPISKGIVVKGNICNGNALAGIQVAASNVIVEGNICYSNNRDSTDVPNRRAGILVQGVPDVSVDGVLIIGNRCFDDQDVQTQQFGISLSQQTEIVSQVLISNNDLRGNGVDSIGALDAQSFRLHSNIGYNPLGLDLINVGPVSPFTYVNNDGVSEAIYITGGAVSDISKNNESIFASSPATILLDPGDTLTVTHSDPPRILKDRR